MGIDDNMLTFLVGLVIGWVFGYAMGKAKNLGVTKQDED